MNRFKEFFVSPGFLFLVLFCLLVLLASFYSLFFVPESSVESFLEKAGREETSFVSSKQEHYIQLNPTDEFRERLFEVALQNSKKHVPERFVREIVDSIFETDFPLLMMALIDVESNFDPYATSRSGAIGCGQVKPSDWHKYLFSKKIVNSVRDYRDPKKCVQISEEVLRYFLKRTNGSIYSALILYQCGESNSKRAIRCRKTVGRKYAERVIEKYTEYASLAGIEVAMNLSMTE